MYWQANSKISILLKRVLSLLSAVVSQLQSGKAILRRIIVVSVVLGVPIFIYRNSFPTSPYLTVGLLAGIASLFMAVSWFKDERLRGLYLLPFSRLTIVAAVSSVGIFSVTLSDVIPVTLAFYLLGLISTIEALITVGVGILAATLSFGCIYLLRSIGVRIMTSQKPLQANELTVKRSTSVSALDRKKVFLSVNEVKRSGVSANYFLTSIFRDVNTLFSLLGLIVIGLVATELLLERGSAVPVHAVCVALTPPLATLLSRDLHTRRQMLILESDRTIAVQYLVSLLIAVMPLILFGDILFVLLGQTVSIGFIVSSIVAYLAAAIVIIVLEMRFPILKWKTENEMYMHPRRYLPLLAAVVVAGIFYLI